MATYWYALRSKPRKEETLWRQLRAQNIEVFYPQIRVQPVNPRARKVRPYFPGYMFVSVDLEAVGLSTFQWMPHAVGLVTYGGEPANVPENLIHAIRRRVDEINAAGGELFDGLNKGDAVKITGGPFEGYEAIFDVRLDGLERVRVLLSLISDRSMPLELDAGQIEKTKKKERRPRRKKRR
jgi:transcriptional antiterminator RfaH